MSWKEHGRATWKSRGVPPLCRSLDDGNRRRSGLRLGRTVTTQCTGIKMYSTMLLTVGRMCANTNRALFPLWRLG